MLLRRVVLLTVITGFTSFPALASSSTITFLGAIKEDTCQVNVRSKTVSADCPRTLAPTTLAIQHLATGKTSSFKQATMHLTWLDNTQRKGIVTTSYR